MGKRAGTSDSQAPRRGLPKPVGELLAGAGAGAFRRYGFAGGQLVAHWREVVGPLYARWSVPECLRPARGRAGPPGATLVVRVEGPFALQLQHAEPAILERCNRILGGSVVARLRIVQGPVARPRPGGTGQALAAGNPDQGPSLRTIADADLRVALEDLARAVGTTAGIPRVR